MSIYWITNFLFSKFAFGFPLPKANHSGAPSGYDFDNVKTTQDTIESLSGRSNGPWKVNAGPDLKPCWTKPASG